MKHKRRRYIIDTRLQIRYALLFVLISLISNMVAVAVFNVLALKQLDALMWSTHISINSTDELVRPVFMFVNAANFLVVAVLLLMTGFLMIKKTTGPLIRMSRDIRKVTDGDLTATVVLREKDDFKDVAGELNSMTGQLRERFSNLKEHYEEISGPVQLLGETAVSGADTVKTCDAILKGIEGMEAELGRMEP